MTEDESTQQLEYYLGGGQARRRGDSVRRQENKMKLVDVSLRVCNKNLPVRSWIYSPT
jgi:hypothetical protein